MHGDQEQPVSEHIRELRSRIIWVIIFFFLTFILGVVYAKEIFEWIRQDSIQQLSLYTFSPGQALKVWMQIGFICAVVLTLPFILYHIWQFVRPGLKSNEQKSILLYIPASILLFIGGISFGYFVLFPYLIQFLMGLNQLLGLQEMYNVYEYFSFMVNIVLPLGFLFELPVIILFLTRIRLVTPHRLMKLRRFAYLAIVVLAAVITPPDVISAIIVAIPLILLYELSILLAHWLYKRMEREEVIEEENLQ
jgi:sec-independent protein translocase protein TatC